MTLTADSRLGPYEILSAIGAGEWERCTGHGGNPYYDVSRNGKRFVMLEIADATREKQLHVVLHADEEVRRLTSGSSR